MLYCPICGLGYEEVEVCPRCEKRLRAQIDPTQLSEPMVLVETTAFCNMPEMIMEVLEQNGIYCMLNPMEIGASFQMNIMVPESKGQQAKELIEAYFGETPETGKITCPHCGEVVPEYKIVCPKCHNQIGD